MADILFFPLPEFGHIAPTLPLAARLIQRGHRVTYLTAPQFREDIATVGATLAPLLEQTKQAVAFSATRIWYEFVHSRPDSSRSQGLNERLLSLLEGTDFSLVLSDGILARNYRTNISAIIGEQRSLYFATSLPQWNWQPPDNSSVPTIVFCPEVFELPKFRIQRKGIFYVEPSLRPMEPEAALGPFPMDASKIVIATFGSQWIRYRSLPFCVWLIFELAKRWPQVHFMIALGSHRCPLDPMRPRNVFLYEKIPQRWLLSRASAQITHGGLGSIKEAIIAGVPQLVLPMLHDQPYNAMRVRHNGLGEAIFPDKRTVDRMDEALACPCF